MTRPSPTRRAALAGAAAALAAPGLARAQNFPTRPVTLVIPFPPGGTTDVAIRAASERAGQVLGRNIVIENRPGAGATLGAADIARSAPDGYRITQMIAPIIRMQFLQQMPYEVPRDFTPIINMTGYMFGILVRAESPFRTWADYVAEAKRRPGELSMGNTGIYGSPHLGAVELAEREGIDIIHTPFRGEGDAIPAILGGHVDASVVASGAGGQVDAGRARWLNVWTAQRSRRWPDAPTLIELGHQGMAITSPYGLVGPAGMDPAIVRVLHDAFKQGIESPAHQAVLERFDMVNDYRSSEDYAAWLREQVGKERAVIERVRARQRP